MSTIAKTLSEAQAAKGEIRAGGTDLMDRLRHGLATKPIVDIAQVPGIDQIEMGPNGACTIGALVTVDEIANSAAILENALGLAKAAGALANPQIRRAATLGGALLQRNRCWYYRHPDMACYKKGGNSCPMREGNHQFGVCIDLGPCVAPHPSTLGMALLAYDAEVEIFGKGRRKVAELYGDGTFTKSDHLLEEGDVLTHVHFMGLMGDAAYFRSISRAQAEWPLVEVLAIGDTSTGGFMHKARVVIGGVANIPLALPKIDAFLNGNVPTMERIMEAGRMAAEMGKPLPNTAYKVELIEKTIVTALQMAFMLPNTD